MESEPHFTLTIYDGNCEVIRTLRVATSTDIARATAVIISELRPPGILYAATDPPMPIPSSWGFLPAPDEDFMRYVRQRRRALGLVR